MTSKDAYIAQMKLQLHQLHARMAELEVEAWLALGNALDKYI